MENQLNHHDEEDLLALWAVGLPDPGGAGKDMAQALAYNWIGSYSPPVRVSEMDQDVSDCKAAVDAWVRKVKDKYTGPPPRRKTDPAEMWHIMRLIEKLSELGIEFRLYVPSFVPGGVESAVGEDEDLELEPIRFDSDTSEVTVGTSIRFRKETK